MAITRRRELRRRSTETLGPPDPIETLSVYDLFGNFTFENLHLRGGEKDVPNLAFLYGDNGVGKTTILKMLYSMLSHLDNDGRRTYLAQVPFSKITIAFRSGQKVEVSKKSGLIGSYSYIFQGPRINARFEISTTEDNRVTGEENPDIDNLILAIDSLGIEILYVPENREILSTYSIFPRTDYEEVGRNVSWAEPGRVYIGGRVAQAPAVRQERANAVLRELLSETLTATHRRFIDKSIAAGTLGDQEAAQVYLQLARSITGSAPPDGADNSQLFSDMLAVAERLQGEIAEYVSYGLLPDLRIAEMRRILDEADIESIPQLNIVISPYLKSIAERLDASKDILRLMKSYADAINEFLRWKKVTVHRRSGIKFQDLGGKPLEPGELSSGEKHILFLFSSAILSSDRYTLVLIDEPEISLNYKWQRKLVPALLPLSPPESVHYILASHSLEIMSEYEGAIQELKP